MSTQTWLKKAISIVEVAPNHPASKLLRRAGRFAGPNMIRKTPAAVAYAKNEELRLKGKFSETTPKGVWISWAGGECPIPDVSADMFRIRLGNETEDFARHWVPENPPLDYTWDHKEKTIYGDIIAYMVLEESLGSLASLKKGVVYYTDIDGSRRFSRWEGYWSTTHLRADVAAKSDTGRSLYQNRKVLREATPEELKG